MLFAIAIEKSVCLVFKRLASLELLIKAVSTKIAGILESLKTAKLASLCPLLGIPNLLAIDLDIFADKVLVAVFAVG